ncbi:ubiquitin carboxyl-terminal hydrolase 30 homolog isoform X1 [Myzus persicae]|uniref:ubiquitin carboxyl-terminal hydrolase 30 homolog isoform X1 n=1 Tax=Myzus persicae TaxID=13164 RepID=UPI000B937EC6|nr:ubiquitin carboxyl-terminal hydrolase 30 homolog isoform X1 [Myzus persicae]
MFKIHGNHLAFIGVTGAGLALVAYVLFGPSNKPKSTRKSGFCGLQNLGTTCYLNTLLQSLASCPMFVEWLDQQSKSSTVSYTLNKTLKFLTGARYNDDGILSPIELVTILTKVGFHFKPNLQADVHELFIHLFSVIEDEAYKSSCSLADCLETNGNLIEKGNIQNSMKIINNISINVYNPSKAEGNLLENTAVMSNNILNISGNIVLQGDRKSLDKNQNVKPAPFLGYLSNNIECSLCHHKLSLNYEKFYVISLSLPEYPQLKIELTDILDQYIKQEKLENLPCTNCDENNTKTDGKSYIKSVKFGKLPSCLCLHLVRTQYSRDRPLKRKDFVEFPEYLHMDKYTSVYDQLSKLRQSREKSASEPLERLRGNKYTYRLKAVIVHAGEHNSGHFSTYRRGVTTDHSRHRCSETRWFFTSDAHIEEVTLQQVLQSVVYMLFYEKCDT